MHASYSMVVFTFAAEISVIISSTSVKLYDHEACQMPEVME